VVSTKVGNRLIHRLLSASRRTSSRGNCHRFAIHPVIDTLSARWGTKLCLTAVLLENIQQVVCGRPPSVSVEAILVAASCVFRKHGHGATTAEIARRASGLEGILFHRTKSNEALLGQVWVAVPSPSQTFIHSVSPV
jgi:hypothetical protein